MSPSYVLKKNIDIVTEWMNTQESSISESLFIFCLSRAIWLLFGFPYVMLQIV